MADPHVLFCAFAEVPGASAAGTRMGQWLSVFGNREVDALSLKGREAAHIQRLGGARMMRVPNTSGKPFLERLSTYQRALQRQLAGDQYDLIWCGDLFSGAVVAQATKDRVPIVVEIAEVPSQSLGGKQLVAEDTGVVQKRWREQERLAVRAASKVLLPSRHAAKLLSERVDARIFQVVPRCVDRTVFTPPSVEIDIDDDRRVLVFGGREGGPALRAAVGIAHALATRLPANVSIGLLGQPSLNDAEVRAALQKKNLADRVDLVDADGPLAVSAALSLAHVVVVPSAAEEEAEPFGIPHRALEAMSCGRAVVLTGPEAAFRDAATPGEHVVVSPARDPQRAAAAAESLLDDDERRGALAIAASRHVERTADLAARSTEVAQMVLEAARIKLRIHAPRTDDPDTSSKSVPSQARAAPRAEASAPSGPNPLGPGGTSIPTVRMEAPAFSHVESAAWEGDTFLDGGPAPHMETSPDAVRAAMLLSSDAQSKAGESSLPTVPPGSVQSVPSAASVPTSIIVQAALESRSSSSDPWAADTIADGMPVETRGADPAVLHRAPTSASNSRKSFLVDARQPSRPETPPTDLTAEDAALSDSSSSSSSSDSDED